MNALGSTLTAAPLSARTIVVVPCYNEESRLPAQRFVDFARAHPDIGFVFVDDGSRDGTQALLRTLEEAVPDSVRTHTLTANCGKCEAVRQGLLVAVSWKPTFVGYWDADLATPLCELPRFIALGERDPDLFLIMGSRIQKLGSRIDRSFWRHCVGRLFATMASGVLGLDAYDTQCGAKVIRVDRALRNVLQSPFRGRWTFDVELIQRLVAEHRQTEPGGPIAALHAGIIEVPLDRWTDVAGSKLRIADGLMAFVQLATMWIRVRTRES
jgi:dolichyl-phosphate beta-glucosyltransferase